MKVTFHLILKSKVNKRAESYRVESLLMIFVLLHTKFNIKKNKFINVLSILISDFGLNKKKLKKKLGITWDTQPDHFRFE